MVLPETKKCLAGCDEGFFQVLPLVAEGLTNAEIAERLYIGAGTVKTHVARLLTKFDARDRVQLVIHAYRSGLAA
ncbi:response regulator transcription factor [Streptomyces hokutonensis]|uniref:response regulator transcription factor n=1 Tax=Streptomyces hokutonensis TaxID=1306990 RepID=UPI003675A469